VKRRASTPARLDTLKDPAAPCLSMEPEESAKLAALFVLLGLIALLFLSWTVTGLLLLAFAIAAGIDARVGYARAEAAERGEAEGQPPAQP